MAGGTGNLILKRGTTVPNDGQQSGTTTLLKGMPAVQLNGLSHAVDTGGTLDGTLVYAYDNYENRFWVGMDAFGSGGTGQESGTGSGGGVDPGQTGGNGPDFTAQEASGAATRALWMGAEIRAATAVYEDASDSVPVILQADWANPSDVVLVTQKAIKDYVGTLGSLVIADIGVKSNTMYPMMVDGTGAQTVYIDISSTPFSYTPNTNTLTVSGDLAVNGGDITTTSTGTATIFNTNITGLSIGSSVTSGTINFGSNSSGTGTVNIGGSGTTRLGTSGTSPGTVEILSNPSISGTKTINIGTGTSSGTTNVTIGSTSGTSTVALQGNATLTGDLSIGGGAAPSSIKFLEASANGTNFVAFKAPLAITNSRTYTLPDDFPDANKVLQSDVSGILTWVSAGNASTVSIGSSGNDIPYGIVLATTGSKDGTASLVMDSLDNITYNPSTDTLSVGSSVSVGSGGDYKVDADIVQTKTYVKMYNSGDGSGSVTLKAPATSGSSSNIGTMQYTFPLTMGSAGQVLKIDTVTGTSPNFDATLTWGSASAGTVDVTDDDTSATLYPMFSTVTTGSTTVKVDSDGMTYNANTDTLTVPNLVVNGTTTTVNTNNLTVSDTLIMLNSGAASNDTNDIGLIMERGSTGGNAAFFWDESEDKFTLGLTTNDASSAGAITLDSVGTLVSNLEGATVRTVADGSSTLSLQAYVSASTGYTTVIKLTNGSGNTVSFDIGSAGAVGTINNASIGATNRSTGAFTTLTSNSATTFTAGTASTNTTTGTLVVTGGVGISGATYIGGNLSIGGNVIAGTWNGTTIATGYGGTGGTATPTAGAVAYGTGSAYAFTAQGTSGYVLKSNGSSAPDWVDPTTLTSGSILVRRESTPSSSVTRYPIPFLGSNAQNDPSSTFTLTNEGTNTATAYLYIDHQSQTINDNTPANYTNRVSGLFYEVDDNTTTATQVGTLYCDYIGAMLDCGEY